MAKQNSPGRKPKTKTTPKPPRVNPHRKPEKMELREWQLALRRNYGIEQTFVLENQGDHPVWSDFSVANLDRQSVYRLALRGVKPFENYCGCPDYAANGLGTCKHIEWALHRLKKTRGNKKYFHKNARPVRAYSSVYLHYGEARQVRLRIGADQADALRALAADYFDHQGVLRPEAYLRFEQFLEQARALASELRCYPDVLAFVIEHRDDQRRASRADTLAAQPDATAQLIKATLFPYQRAGVLFAFRAGRCLLADEMGLGKTIQAIAAAELFRREWGISGAVIICPTSLKYQWRSEIRKFTGQEALVVEGPATKRYGQYADDGYFFKILTYNVVARDYHYLNQSAADLVILDEAQRIKNWDTKISYAVKRLEAPYRFALTGTPLENKLEDLYSIVQFLDQHLLGPLYLLLHRHQVKDENGMVRGYHHLDEISAKLSPVMIRRRKRDVLKELPLRMDKNLLVPMTPRQMQLHNSYELDVAMWVAKWRKQGFLLEQDRRKLLANLTLMRMACDSVYLVDQHTRADTKIQELVYILEERLADPSEKVVVFSQWERMTRLVAHELDEMGVDYAYLHGGIPSEKRGELLDRFREDDNCRIFLSTDAGGVGLNLQTAAMVVNLDLPWNPAVLEQRIGRVYRMGQARAVQVINLISEGTIEHRMLATLKFKSTLADAVLEATEDSVMMNDNRFREFMEQLDQVTQAPVDAPGEPDTSGADTDLEVPSAVPSSSAEDPDLAPSAWTEDEDIAPAPSPAPTPAASAGAPGRKANTARELVSDGLSVLGRLAATLADENATRQLVEEITERDERTGQTYLKIPVESAETVQGVIQLFSGLLGKLNAK